MGGEAGVTVRTERRAVTKEENVVIGVTCDGCAKDLDPIFKDVPDPWETIQPVDALTVMIDGGFGMFFDNLDDRPLAFVLCKDCANKLLDLFPAMRVAVQRIMEKGTH